jgi:hypothetical protein
MKIADINSAAKQRNQIYWKTLRAKIYKVLDTGHEAYLRHSSNDTKLHNINQRNAQFSKITFNFLFLLSPTCFETLVLILRETALYAVRYVGRASVWAGWWIGVSNTFSYPQACARCFKSTDVSERFLYSIRFWYHIRHLASIRRHTTFPTHYCFCRNSYGEFGDCNTEDLYLTGCAFCFVLSFF